MTIDIPIANSHSPQSQILNYSIVSSDDEDNPLVVKLKVSQSNKIPMVVIKKLDDNYRYTASPRTSNRIHNACHINDTDVNMDKLRKNPCSTPKKKDYSDEALDNLCTAVLDKVKLKTPVKRSASTYEDKDVSPRKKGSVEATTPRRNISRTLPASCSKGDENDVFDPVRKRRSVAPVRYIDEFSPKSVNNNLNESFRRTILKTRLNLDNIDQNKTRKSARKKSMAYYYDTEEDESVEILQVSRETSKTHQRSRSNSTVSKSSDDTPSRQCRKNMRMRPESMAQEQSPPRTPINKKQTGTPKTPKNRLKMIRDGVITPSMQSRKSIINGNSTPLMQARTHLHVSYVPTSLPCREKEYTDVYNFLRGKLDDGCGGCMYISGVPGTGKTATVTAVIDHLIKDKQVAKFSYVSINGMKLTEPRQSYVEIWKQLTGKTVPWEQAQSLLEARFTKKKNSGPVVILIDELDILCTKRQDVVYNLLDWPSKSKDQLIVITIANTMDLPERLLMSRVTSRLGLTRLTFQAYTHKQLIEIVTKRLTGTDSFNSDAVQLVARKVASVSGDARRALDICRRAAEIAEEEGKNDQVTIMHINEALTAMITQPQVIAMRRCSRLQKLLLRAIVAEIERTGVEETTFADVFKMLVSCCALDGFKMVSSTTAHRALGQLSACKLVLTDQKCSDIYQRIILNVSVHDVYFALKNE